MDLPRDPLVPGVDWTRCLVGEPVAFGVYQDPVRHGEDRRLRLTGARVDGLGVEHREVARGRRAGGQGHLDSLALVVVTAACHRPGEHAPVAVVTGHHLRVALIAAAGEHDHAGQRYRPVRRDGAQSGDRAGVRDEGARRRPVEDLDAELLGLGGERLDQGETAADR